MHVYKMDENTFLFDGDVLTRKINYVKVKNSYILTILK